MKRGIKYQPLPNVPMDEQVIVPEIMGIPVRYNRHYASVAHADGLIGFKHIIVGPAWLRLDPRMRQAVLLHEAKHALGYHLEKRLLLLAAIAIPPLVILPWPILATVIACLAIYACWEWEGRQQEKEADAFAVQRGYGPEMARFLNAHHRSMPDLFYPDFEARMANIERLMKQSKGANDD